MRYMASNLKKILIILLICMMAGYISGTAEAYVLQGTHLLELMMLKSRRAKRMLVSQKLVIFDSNLQTGPVELDETLRYLFPESFRSDILSENIKRIHITSKGSAVTVIDGRILSQPETGFDLYKDIILYHSRVRLNERLTLLGVDVTVTSLGRFEDKIFYVMGAQYPDKSHSQIWIDRESFRPLRWLIVTETADGSKDILEVRYMNWGKVSGTWYPMRTEFYEGERLVREIRVEHIKAEPSFSPNLFDVQRVRSLYQPVAAAAPEQKVQSEIIELNKTIEDFKKLFE